MEYKHKANSYLYNSYNELVENENNRLGLGGLSYKPQVINIHPKIKDNPTISLEIPESATEEEKQLIEQQNEQIHYNNIEYMIKEYKSYEIIEEPIEEV